MSHSATAHDRAIADMRLDGVLRAVLHLRAALAILDELDIDDVGAHVDLALCILEPYHPDVVAGLHGPRPFPARLERHNRSLGGAL